jgi:hypothetical protein
MGIITKQKNNSFDNFRKNAVESMGKYTIKNITVAAIFVVGVAISLFQFLYNRSLWGDEAMLALNIIHRSGAELLQPLDYVQVAPVLFLQIEKFFSILLPPDYGLRFFPLLSFWASIYFFQKIIRKHLNSVYAVIMALSLFVFGYTFLYYSNEMKQYMSDILVLLCVFWFVLKDYKQEHNKYYILGIIGVISISLSNVAPIILFTCGVYICYVHFFVNRKTNLMPLLPLFSVWLGVFAAYYAFFIYEHPVKEAMTRFWSHPSNNAFLPSNPIKPDFYMFFVQKIKSILVNLTTSFDGVSNIVGRGMFRIVIGILFMWGMAVSIRNKNIRLIILTCTPIVLHLFLSAFQLYPFATRLVLYTLPGVIVICSLGFDRIMKLPTNRETAVCKPAVMIIVPSLFLFFLFWIFPIKKFEIKESIRYIQENSSNCNNIYLSPATTITFAYYRDTGFANHELNVMNRAHDVEERTSATTESWRKSNVRIDSCINELKKLQHRSWLLVTKQMNDETIIIHTLDSLGYKRLKEFHTTGSAAYLYDFGEKNIRINNRYTNKYAHEENSSDRSRPGRINRCL